MRFTIVVLMLAGTSATANTEIHSCLLDDGTIAFQQKPCSEPAVNVDDSSEVGESRNANETPAADDDVFDFVKPFDQPATPPTPLISKCERRPTRRNRARNTLQSCSH